MLKDITLSALWSAMVELPEIVNPSLLEFNFRVLAWINKKYKVLLKDTKKTNHPMMEYFRYQQYAGVTLHTMHPNRNF